jgi:UDP-3-O-[3-hydroxymyristoyl] glucosamine N-acyltransferase
MQCSVHELAKKIDAEVRGDGSATIIDCATLGDAGEHDLSFLANPRYFDQLKITRAAAVIVSPADAKRAPERTLLIAKDPYFAFRQAAVELLGFRKQPPPSISGRAVVAESAHIGRDCFIGDFTVVDQRATIGDRCIIYPHVYIGPDAIIGDDCILYPQVTIYDRCVLGQRVTLHAGCSIGQDGFGYATHDGQHHKIPPAGNAVIEDDVEMGAHCSVDRASMGSTVIGTGTKFSNNVTIAHGSQIGKHNLFVAQVGIAGSTQTGDYVVLGGQAGAAGHLRIGHRVQAAGRTGILRDIDDDAKISGMPAINHKDNLRIWSHTQHLGDLAARVRKLEQQLEKHND